MGSSRPGCAALEPALSQAEEAKLGSAQKNTLSERFHAALDPSDQKSALEFSFP